MAGSSIGRPGRSSRGKVRFRPEAVIPSQKNERLLPPEAAMRVSGSSSDPADDCNWVESGMAGMMSKQRKPNSRPEMVSPRCWQAPCR